MSIALAALIIALASLMWNVVSTVYSWKFSKPAIAIETTPRWTNEKQWVDVNVVNTGGSAVAIKEIMVWWWFAKGKARNNPMRGAWLRRLQRRFSKDDRPKPIARSFNDPDTGPDLPHTIQPYHDETWSFDWSLLRKVWLNSSNPTKSFLIQVRLSNGKKAKHRVEVSRMFGPHQ
jgi:hypothetical protein